MGQDQYAILDEVDALVAVIDLESNTVLYGNRRLLEQCGQESVGRKCWEVLQNREGDHCEICGDIWRNRKAEPGETHCWVSKKHHSERIFEHHERIITWNGGTPARLVISTDITDRVRYEEMLEQSEARYRSIFSRARSVILLINPADGRIVDANQAACDFYGYDHETMTSMFIMDINTLSPEEIFREMQKAKTEERGHFKFRHKLADGDIRDVEVYCGPVNIQGVELLYSLIHDVTERVQLEQELLFRANHDSLTGILNRRRFMERVDKELSRAARYRTPFGLIMLDLDHFKIINDTYGHLAGDKVLIAVANEIAASLRDTDFCGRLGGEEFGVALLHTSPKEAEMCAERIRDAVQRLLIRSGGSSIEVTISAGVTCHTAVDHGIDDIFRRADAALYRAKSEGRNKVSTLVI